MKPPASGPPAERAGLERGPVGPLSILLSCPHCGAPSTVDDDAVSLTCAHCDSFLVLSRPGRDELYIAQSQVADAADVRDTVLLYRVEAQRAEIVARYGGPSDDDRPNTLSEEFIQAKLREFEQQLRAEVKVLEAHRLQAPYWHIEGMIVQSILGRERDGPKEMRVRAFGVEHTVPGYDVAGANLRDRGLRLSRSRVRPLTRKDVAAHGPFIPWVEVPERSYREIRKWEGQDLDAAIEPVTKLGAFLFARRVLVYRSYWLARVITDLGQSWVLVDGGFNTIAGYPGEVEAQALLKLPVPDPEGRESRQTRAVLVSHRCPDCGFEQRFDPHAHVAICPNCHLALRPGEKGIRIVPCHHAVRGAPDLDAAFLPFWAFAFRVEVPGGRTLDRLEDYAAAIHSRGLPPAFHPSGRVLWVPAFRLLGTEVGDETFKEVAQWIHGAPPLAQEGKVPLGGKASFGIVSVAESEAAEMATIVLHALHDTTSAARLNTLLLRKTVQQAKVTLSAPRLVMVPFDRAADALVAPESRVRIPRLLLEGGPELEAQQVTVHRPRRQRDEPPKWSS